MNVACLQVNNSEGEAATASSSTASTESTGKTDKEMDKEEKKC